MRIVNKPWGFEKIWAETDNYLGKVLSIDPGHKLSRQFHNFKEETFMVQFGVLTLEIGEGDKIVTHILLAGDSFHCPPKTIHRMICDPKYNEEAVEVLEVSTAHLTDVVRLEDDYNRNGT